MLIVRVQRFRNRRQIRNRDRLAGSRSNFRAECRFRAVLPVPAARCAAIGWQDGAAAQGNKSLRAEGTRISARAPWLGKPLEEKVWPESASNAGIQNWQCRNLGHEIPSGSHPGRGILDFLRPAALVARTTRPRMPAQARRADSRRTRNPGVFSGFAGSSNEFCCAVRRA